MSALHVIPVRGLPELMAGDDLAALIADATPLQDGDVVVVSQKAISKIEGAVVTVDTDALQARRDLARGQARRIVADTPGVLVVATRHGLICANAGVDASNAPAGQLVLLPQDPDASAARLRDALRDRLGVDVGVIVADTFGRAWRAGQTDVAIGAAGVSVLRDERGGVDRSGRVLAVTLIAVADELAAAADLVRRKADGVPVVVIRGFDAAADAHGTGADLIRPREHDLFAHGRGWLGHALAGAAGFDGARSAPLADWERDLVATAAGRSGGDAQVTWEGDELVITGEAFAAGAAVAAAEAVLLDLDYRPKRRHDTGRWHVRVAELEATRTT